MRLKSKEKKSISFLEKLPTPVSPRALQIKSCFKLRRLQYECDKSCGVDVSYDCAVLTLAVTQQRGKKSHPYSPPVLSSQIKHKAVIYFDYKYVK